MGEEIQRFEFSPSDFEKFSANLKEETLILREWFRQGVFDSPEKFVGFELESWLVDSNYSPSPSNKEFLSRLNNPLVVPELAKFNTEINSNPYPLSGKTFREMELFLAKLWSEMGSTAREVAEGRCIMIGSLPTLNVKDLNLDTMSDMDRYRALNLQVMKLKKGKPMELHIEGQEILDAVSSSVMLEASATSLQIHLTVEPELAARYFNAAQIVSPLSAALAANSPIIFGHSLWQESRIPVLEQSLHLPGFYGSHHQVVNRVSFGSGYLESSLEELFIENQEVFPIILPYLFDGGAESMRHLRLHNGTIWRWNRPVLGVGDGSQKPNIRVEHRVPASGPKVTDVVANIVFFVGAVQYLATSGTPPEHVISFEDCWNNFYRSAKSGLDTRIRWKDAKDHKIGDILLSDVFPKAKRGLLDLGVDSDDVNHYFDDVLIPRVDKSQTGALWQLKYLQKNSSGYRQLLEDYFLNQETNQPVWEWKV